MKKQLLFITILLASYGSTCQTTAIPDPVFETLLINGGYDSGPLDGQVLTASIDTITTFEFGGGVTDPTGIEDFAALTKFTSAFANYPTIDLTQNTALTYLYLGDSFFLTSIDLSQNTLLTHLDLNNSALIDSLDVSQNTALTYLNIVGAKFKSIDLSNNLALEELQCDHLLEMVDLDLSHNTALNELNVSYAYKLTCLNVKNGNNTQFIDFDARFSPYLNCITVDDSTWSANNLTNVDVQTSFSTDCMDACSAGQPASIDEEEMVNRQIFAYPNPASGQLTVDLKGFYKTINAVLFNSLGQSVYSKEFINSDQISIEMEAPKGIYFLGLNTDSGQRHMIKIIKE